MKNQINMFIGGTIFVLLIQSCSGSDTLENTAENENSNSPQDSVAAFDSLALLDATSFSLPASFSNTNIEDYFDETQDIPLTLSQIQELQLNELETCGGCDLYLLGKIHFSDKFKTRLIFRNAAWNEWKMWLVNYDSQNKMLDYLLILYGDNVEYYSETFSDLAPGAITVTHVTYDYSSDESDSTAVTETFLMDERGIFVEE